MFPSEPSGLQGRSVSLSLFSQRICTGHDKNEPNQKHNRREEHERVGQTQGNRHKDENAEVPEKSDLKI